MGESENVFRFKRFAVSQDVSTMKVGTDGVLLACWADLTQADRILDIGTGTGVMALIAAQRAENAQVHAIEIDQMSFFEATHNVASSEFSGRMYVFPGDIREFDVEVRYDHILCNPPFFTDGLVADGSRGGARHQAHLNPDDLMSHIVRLSTTDGRASIIMPYSSRADILGVIHRAGLFVHHITSVRPTTGSDYKRILISMGRQARVEVHDEIVIEKYGRHRYSEEYIDLTMDFYLKM